MRESWEIERERDNKDVERLRLLWFVVIQRWHRDFQNQRPELRKADGRRLPLTGPV